MKKTTKILTALTLFAAVCGGGYYYTQLYPDHKDISRLEILIHQREFYRDKLAKAELDIFPIYRLRELAKKDYPIAQYILGNYYQEEENKEEARVWFKLAANQNFAPAYRSLAETYDKGSYNYKRFLAKAVSLGDVRARFIDASNNIPVLEELAKMDYLSAQALLTSLYFEGKIQNWEKALYWAEKYYENAKKHNTDLISSVIYHRLAKLYYLGVGTTPNITKAEEVLAEYAAAPNLFPSDRYYKQVSYKDLNHLKMELVADKDMVKDKVAQAKIQQLSDELQANNGAERFLKQANIILDMALEGKDDPQIYAIKYFGVACDMGSQAGCDKYAEMNTK
ncbi:tetratricopeptide repeat protein [Glaesserella parasuis]|uniref:tetratricopeptide repeat protein n=1 Tax=Glaesserella parasuis TaxID=738 RepID=UPI001365F8C8|nr:SEL1-like repeat protein [Glaesserella parasuis]MDG6410627.1 SEL1-like repeat protein [Glaesserella parasuis]MDG6472010.1 SEL1-like repeat protein [Glaesserella parasuis]MDO9665453.1 SEL1-like repeat protein [Glaesserella parasuis]MDO9731367.1 SEL1-like repeat protein [Glaesserella parasuis]MDO9764969.1 SEL1-like repeat protein [Glaesserella parasuis]